MFKKVLLKAIFLILISSSVAFGQKLLMPMDLSQTDHLKAYGVAYWCLEKGYQVEWLLNYKAGSFMTDAREDVSQQCKLQGVVYSVMDLGTAGAIYQEIEENNMEVVLLEKAPRIGVYVPPTHEPWDDAVRLALDYAEIPYTTLWDEEVLRGDIFKFDWLHLHHEDFTGQYGKFYSMFFQTPWYKQEVAANENLAKKLGFKKVSDMKKTVARAVKNYIGQGGFVFAMCSAPETFDIALAAEKLDVVPPEFDGDPFDPNCQSSLDYSLSLAFTNFTLSLNAMEYRHSTIDVTEDRILLGLTPQKDYFTLFDFSAKLDPVPCMLVQDHVPMVPGFMGQCTAFRKFQVKKYVTILGETEGQEEIKYLHGNFGKGTFTFLGGHDPEDYQHQVGDPPTDLSLHKNSPGYRLILNNVLFPAAKKKERKT
ncbi:MAG TPA: asparagine synthetase B [candidate division Zixibacteria bacterium]|nr:asparagine synthetase B [candidate division Zixibacteria bacterium]